MKTLTTLSIVAITLLFIGCDSSSTGEDAGSSSSNSSASSVSSSASSQSSTITGNGLVDTEKYDSVTIYQNISDAKLAELNVGTAPEYEMLVESPSYSCLDLGFSVNESYTESDRLAYRDENGTLHIGDSSLPNDLTVYKGKFYTEYSSDGTSFTSCQEFDYMSNDIGESGTKSFARLFDTSYFEL